MHSCSSAHPSPLSPRTPKACASSTYSHTLAYFFFRRTSSRRSASSPSMLKMLSVTMMIRSYSVWFISINRSNWSYWLCRYRMLLAADKRIPSIRLACTSLSAKISVRALLTAGRIPVLAWYPLLNTSAASVPKAVASCCSNCSQAVKFPVSRREEEEVGRNVSGVSVSKKSLRNSISFANPK